MRPRLAACLLLLSALALRSPASAQRETVSVAAAANLIHALDELHAEFKRRAPEVNVVVTSGASGNLYAQLQHGAPFDVFLSADTEYPTQAVAARLADAPSLQVFATGRLVLWTMRTGGKFDDLAAVLASPAVKKVALAQPRTAPYGRAAQAALDSLRITAGVRRKLVFGESIAQTAQFVETGSADVGFVALSLVRSPRLAGQGRWFDVPAALYTGVSLDHAAVLTNRGARNPAAVRFLEFLSSAPARKILHDFGYGVPATVVR